MTDVLGIPPVLSVQALAVRYGHVRALDCVDLDVAPGAFMSLLGPSGSGKTTMLNVIAGFIGPSEGVVRHNGKDITAMPPEKRAFGVVFQGYALFPHLTALDNVAYPLRMRGLSRAESRRRAAPILERVGLAGMAGRRPSQLSGGQQQRVAMARALVYQPSILLLDEPLSALDRDLRRRLQIELKALHRQEGRTFVLVTHDQEEAMTLSDHIAVFRAGRVVQVGTPQELYRRPASRFVAEFVGEANVVPADAVQAGPAGKFAVLRPEDVRLSRVGGTSATLTDLVFAGDRWRAMLRDGAGREWLAILPEEQRAQLNPLPGERLAMSWPEGSAWIVAEDGQA
ncbi:ABC transporter ATP-binding protein [Aestuariivirga sp.]|uniref:ABC transporter ATP-binding protein n=1 Tax=Aestuariivirga sp. TaxID=2650926 RepID=UPI0039E3F253